MTHRDVQEHRCCDAAPTQDVRSQFVLAMSSHDSSLRRYLYSLLLSEQAVDEVLQETALTLWEKVEQYDPERPFFPWAARFAYFKVLEYRRRQSQHQARLRQDVLHCISETAMSMRDESTDRRDALRRCLGKLTDQDRDLLMRRYDEGDCVADIAKDQGKSVKQLYNRLDRLRRQLADCVRGSLEGQFA